MKKVCQDYHSFENHPFYLFGPFWAVFDIPEGSFEILIVSDWFNQVQKHPDMSGIQNTLSLSKNLEKSASRLLSPLKITLFTFLALFWPLLTLITVSLKSSLSLICSISYPYMCEA